MINQRQVIASLFKSFLLYIHSHTLGIISTSHDVLLVVLLCAESSMKPLTEFNLGLRTAIIVVSGEEWTVVSFNTTANRWFGERLCVDQPLAQLLANVNVRALNRRLAKGREARFDCDFDLGAGQEIPVEFVCSVTDVIPNGILLEGVERVRARSAELMLTSYSRMIEDKNRELEAAIQARDQFLSTMSHELKTPLNSIVGFSESLLDEIYGELNEDQQLIVQKVFTSGRRLMSLLTNLLNLSRIRSGQLELRRAPTDLRALCEEAVQRFNQELDDKQIHVKIESEQLTTLPNIDTGWCHQIIDHLLGNAIKFSDLSSRIRITISERSEGVRVTVWDEGIGIPPSQHEKIFQPFTQVDASLSRAYEGSGLGLSMVSEVMRLHGGEVSVESTPGEGSSFHLDFHH